MPYRKIPLKAREIYHIYNRSVARQPIFQNQQDCQRALDTISFYRYKKPPLRFSHYKRLPSDQRKNLLEELAKNHKPVLEILAFCLMPNHFHFLLKPLKDNSISLFTGNFQNSYAKYFNIKTERVGSLFQAMFKAVRIETEEQLLHVSRYIHLNPVSSLLIKLESLEKYPWSSFKEYCSDKIESKLVNSKPVLAHFKSRDKYKEFVFDQADYQQELEKIKHLTFEKP